MHHNHCSDATRTVHAIHMQKNAGILVIVARLVSIVGGDIVGGSMVGDMEGTGVVSGTPERHSSMPMRVKAVEELSNPKHTSSVVKATKYPVS